MTLRRPFVGCVCIRVLMEDGNNQNTKHGLIGRTVTCEPVVAQFIDIPISTKVSNRKPPVLKIKWTAGFLDGYTFNRMRVNHGGSDIAVSQQLLYRSDVKICLKQMAGKTVSKCMG